MVAHVFAARPALVLCNGPGTCVPVAVAALLLRLLGELREAAARADMRRSDADVTDELRRFEAARSKRRAAREARGPA